MAHLDAAEERFREPERHQSLNGPAHGTEETHKPQATQCEPNLWFVPVPRCSPCENRTL